MKPPSLKERYYAESRFGGFTDVDGTIAFYTRVNSMLNPSSVVLDFGCGRGAYGEDPVEVRRDLRILKGKAARVVGIDVDSDAMANPFLDKFHLLTGDEWPVADDSVDLCLCDCVIEHLEKPDLFFCEARRVLKDGGSICIRTPNRLGYVSLISRIVPNRSHSRVVKVAQEGRKDEDVFPAYYRCNTVTAIASFCKKYGFEGVVYGYESEPGYLHFSRIAYWLGVMYQRFAPRFLSNAIFAFAEVVKSREPGAALELAAAERAELR